MFSTLAKIGTCTTTVRIEIREAGVAVAEVARRRLAATAL
jgi:hypothetical protein